MNDDIQPQADAVGPWYHPIKLSDDYTTPFYMHVENVWEQNREVRKAIDYKWKKVLDLGTMDGMWAFEAEELGASVVVASDVWDNPRLKVAVKLRKSNAIIDMEGDVHCLSKTFLPRHRSLGNAPFDIIQNLGMLYHIQNPMLALHQIRSALSDTGVMLLETACFHTASEVPICRLNRSPMLYPDGSTYWLPSLLCLQLMLSMTGFELVGDTLRGLCDGAGVMRYTAICKPTPQAAGRDDFGYDPHI